MTPGDDATVFVIDDDARMRAATERLLKSVGLHAEAFASPQEFLRRKLPDGEDRWIRADHLSGGA